MWIVEMFLVSALSYKHLIPPHTMCMQCGNFKYNIPLHTMYTQYGIVLEEQPAQQGILEAKGHREQAPKAGVCASDPMLKKLKIYRLSLDHY